MPCALSSITISRSGMKVCFIISIFLRTSRMWHITFMSESMSPGVTGVSRPESTERMNSYTPVRLSMMWLCR